MSQRRRTVKKRRSSNDDFDESLCTQGASQASQRSSQATQEFSQVNEKTEQHLVANVVKYILAADHTKVPIQKPHLQKFLDCKPGQLKKILTRAKETFTDVFGYELLEIDNKLMLYNLIENNKSPYLEFDNLQPRYVVLFFTLLYIFMAGGTAPEEQIWNFFRNLGLLRNNQFKTEEYGDLNDLILNEFVKDKYLTKSKSENLDVTEIELQWGNRAQYELTYRSVLQFVSKMYNGKDMGTWRQQYNAMIQQEGK